MKKFFLLRTSSMVNISIPITEITQYRKAVTGAMEKMGATSSEIALLREETIINSIKNNRKPEDVAWAILQ